MRIILLKGFNQYAPLGGMIGLKEEIARKIENSHKAVYHPESEITVTAGGTQAISRLLHHLSKRMTK